MHIYYNKSPIKNDIVSLLRKYGGKANCYDKNGNEVGEGKGDLNLKKNETNKTKLHSYQF